MSKQVIITITVDTDTLVKEFPKGGDITDHSLIVMTQEGGYFSYKTAFKDKLVTETAAGDAIKWKITSKNANDALKLVAYKGDKSMLDIFKSQPAKDAADDKEFNGNVKDSLPQVTLTTTYTFDFCLKKQPDIVWSWDPDIIAQYPPR